LPAPAVHRTLNLPQRGRKVLGPNLKCSEYVLGAAVPIRRIARQGTAGDCCIAEFVGLCRAGDPIAADQFGRV